MSYSVALLMRAKKIFRKSENPTSKGVKAELRTKNRKYSLYQDGKRKYLNENENKRIKEVIKQSDSEKYLLIFFLHFTGCRISEALSVCPSSFDIDERTVSIRTLKQRGKTVYRRLLLPPELMQSLNKYFNLKTLQLDEDRKVVPLWNIHRTTAWRWIKAIMSKAGVQGVAATCKGFRHGLGVKYKLTGVDFDLTKEQLGHSNDDNTMIYTEVRGVEYEQIISRAWYDINEWVIPELLD